MKITHQLTLRACSKGPQRSYGQKDRNILTKAIKNTNRNALGGMVKDVTPSALHKDAQVIFFSLIKNIRNNKAEGFLQPLATTKI